VNEPQLRLFVALEIPASVREAFRELSARLRGLCRGARWTDADGIHLTLKFIGEIEAGRRAGIEAALARVRQPSPFAVVFRGAGYFPNHRHPRVLWAGVEAGPELGGLASGVERELEPLGFLRESRPFHPHLTLARFKTEEGLPRLREEVEKLGAPEFGRAEYHQLDLMRSTLRPQGALYSRLARFDFAAPAAGEAQAGEAGTESAAPPNGNNDRPLRVEGGAR
jgi:2'-5' RNA ligase